MGVLIKNGFFKIDLKIISNNFLKIFFTIVEFPISRRNSLEINKMVSNIKRFMQK